MTQAEGAPVTGAHAAQPGVAEETMGEKHSQFRLMSNTHENERKMSQKWLFAHHLRARIHERQ